MSAGAKAKAWLEEQQSRLKDTRVAAVIEQLLPHIESAEINDKAAIIDAGDLLIGASDQAQQEEGVLGLIL